MKRNLLAVLLCILLLPGLLTVPSRAAFVEHENWIEITEEQLNTMFYNNETFIVMAYDISCGKCLARRDLLEEWMPLYDQKVYGLCLNHEQLPYWISNANPTQNITPIVALVNSDHSGYVVSGLLSARLIRNMFDILAGAYDYYGADFSALNARMKANRPADDRLIREQYLQEPDEWFRGDSASMIQGKITDSDKAFAIYANVVSTCYFSFPMEEANADDLYDAVTVAYSTARAGNTYALTDYMRQLLWDAGIPCRMVKGMQVGNGFNQNVPALLDLYDQYLIDGDLDRFAQCAEPLANHYWLEAWVDGRWIVIDPSMAIGSDNYGKYSIRGAGNASYFDLEEQLYNSWYVTWPQQGQGIGWFWDIDYTDSLHVHGGVAEAFAADTHSAWLGMYDADGRMLDCTPVTLEDGTFNLTLKKRNYTEQLAEVRLFLLDENLAPVRMPYSK